MENKRGMQCEISILQDCFIENVSGDKRRKLRFFRLGLLEGRYIKHGYKLESWENSGYEVKNTILVHRKADVMNILLQEVKEYGR